MAVSFNTSSFQGKLTTVQQKQNGAILPTVLLQHVRDYLEFLRDNFPRTCRLWNAMLPNTLNLNRWTYCWHWDGGEQFLRIFQMYQKKSQSIVGLNLTHWEGLLDDNFIQLGSYDLQSLKLHGCHALTERALTYLKTPSSLTHLELTFTKIRDFSLAGLTRFPLKHLCIDHVEGLSDNNLEPIGQLQHLIFLNVQNCTLITNEGYACLKKLPLQVLAIGGSWKRDTNNINDQTVAILSNCTSLTDLTMSNCHGISNLSPLKSLPLKKLNVSGCKNISIAQIMTYLKDHGIEEDNTLSYFRLRELQDLTFFGPRSRAKFLIINIITRYASADKHSWSSSYIDK